MRRRFLSFHPTDEVVTSTGRECVFKQRVYGPNGILQLDFLAFLVGSAVIGNAHLVEDATSARELDGHLGLAAKTLADLGECLRQKGAVKYFDKKAVAAGFLLFQPTDTPLPPHPKDNAIPFGCAKCHGNVGQGGSTTYVLTTGGTVRTVTYYQVVGYRPVVARSYYRPWHR